MAAVEDVMIEHVQSIVAQKPQPLIFADNIAGSMAREGIMRLVTANVLVAADGKMEQVQSMVPQEPHPFIESGMVEHVQSMVPQEPQPVNDAIGMMEQVQSIVPQEPHPSISFLFGNPDRTFANDVIQVDGSATLFPIATAFNAPPPPPPSCQRAAIVLLDGKTTKPDETCAVTTRATIMEETNDDTRNIMINLRLLF